MPFEPRYDHEEARAMRARGMNVQEIADHFGVTKGAISHVTSGIVKGSVPDENGRYQRGDPVPETFTEMRDLAAKEVWKQFKGLKGVAQIQAFNAIRELAKQDPDGGDEQEPDPLIADVVSGVLSLSVERRREILTFERVRLVEELEAIDGALAEMGEKFQPIASGGTT